MPARTLERLLRESAAPATIDYLSLDVEGAEEMALSTFPWGTHSISVLSIERPSAALQRQLVVRGLRFVRHLGTNGEQL